MVHIWYEGALIHILWYKGHGHLSGLILRSDFSKNGRFGGHKCFRNTFCFVLLLDSGHTRIGMVDAVPTPDIIITGTGVEKEHCYIDNQDGVITIVPVARACFMDGEVITKATRLAQGTS